MKFYKNCDTSKEVTSSDRKAKSAKREIKGWVMAFLLVLFWPLFFVSFTGFLPEFLFWPTLIGSSAFVLILMWRRSVWKSWTKIFVTLMYLMVYMM